MRAHRWRLGLLLGLFLLLPACSVLRQLPPAPPSHAIQAGPESRLGRLVAGQGPLGQGESRLRLLESGRAALVARLALVERAEKSLDLQYYLIHADTSGQLLAHALLRAADRGVRVRVLLDDLDAGRHEAAIIGLDAHPNIEIRLFNPFSVRGDSPLGRALEFVGGRRVNHRMHNKLFIADSLLAITGGRNIGDEYFQHDGAVAFHDLDVLAAGAVVAPMSTDFDRYWNSPYVTSVRAIPKPDKRDRLLAQVREDLDRNLSELDQATLFEYMGLDPLEGESEAELSAWCPTHAEFLSDPPDKMARPIEPARLPLARLLIMGLSVRGELLIASPYFVPGQAGLDLLSYIHGKGAAVRVLTNSAAATDVLVVHAGYARYRMPLVLHGIELYELKPVHVAHRFFRRLGGGSSRTSLHSKVLVFDREAVYIGSMNLDPRSLLLNTEAGLLVHSPELAQRAARFIERDMQPGTSYRVRVGARDGRAGLIWQEGETEYADEPNTGFWLRLFVDMLAGLDLEDHL